MVLATPFVPNLAICSTPFFKENFPACFAAAPAAPAAVPVPPVAMVKYAIKSMSGTICIVVPVTLAIVSSIFDGVEASFV